MEQPKKKKLAYILGRDKAFYGMSCKCIKYIENRSFTMMHIPLLYTLGEHPSVPIKLKLNQGQVLRHASVVPVK